MHTPLKKEPNGQCKSNEQWCWLQVGEHARQARSSRRPMCRWMEEVSRMEWGVQGDKWELGGAEIKGDESNLLLSEAHKSGRGWKTELNWQWDFYRGFYTMIHRSWGRIIEMWGTKENGLRAGSEQLKCRGPESAWNVDALGLSPYGSAWSFDFLGFII